MQVVQIKKFAVLLQTYCVKLKNHNTQKQIFPYNRTNKSDSLLFIDSVNNELLYTPLQNIPYTSLLFNPLGKYNFLALENGFVNQGINLQSMLEPGSWTYLTCFPKWWYKNVLMNYRSCECKWIAEEKTAVEILIFEYVNSCVDDGNIPTEVAKRSSYKLSLDSSNIELS